MLSLKFSVKLKLKLRGKCSKHARFNPEIGRGAIRGGCRECLALYEVVAARDKAATALRRFEELAEPYRVSLKPGVATNPR
jgi:hypothetical protein